MKKVNFHTLQSLPTPESWIENALAIPEEEEKEKPAVIPRRSYRLIAAAASLVLVSLIGFAAWLLFGRTPAPIITAPKNTASTESVVSTEGALASTESATAGETGTTPTQAPTAPADTNTDTTVSAPTEPAAAPAQNAPTEAPTERPDSPIVVPTERPTEATVRPTEITVYPTEVTAEPSEPAFYPTETPWFYENEVISDVPGSKFPENGRIYCAIYDSDGSMFGDADPYSDQHLATVLRYEKWHDSYLVVYRPSEKDVLPRPGYYTYCFYDENGNVYHSDTRPLR